MHAATLLLSAAAALAVPHQVPLNQAPSHGYHGEQHTTARETEDEAVQHTAELLHKVRTGVLASVYPENHEFAGYPMAMMESHAPCHPDGSLTFISMPISLMQRNIKATGGKSSYAVGTVLPPGEHHEYEKPRASITGNFTVLEGVSEEEHKRLSECFVKYHPESKWWLPGDERGAHLSHWARFDVDDIYYVGGFGNVGHIGHLPLDKYVHAMEKYHDHKLD